MIYGNLLEWLARRKRHCLLLRLVHEIEQGSSGANRETKNTRNASLQTISDLDSEQNNDMRDVVGREISFKSWNTFFTRSCAVSEQQAGLSCNFLVRVASVNVLFSTFFCSVRRSIWTRQLDTVSM